METTRRNLLNRAQRCLENSPFRVFLRGHRDYEILCACFAGAFYNGEVGCNELLENPRRAVFCDRIVGCRAREPLLNGQVAHDFIPLY